MLYPTYTDFILKSPQYAPPNYEQTYIEDTLAMVELLFPQLADLKTEAQQQLAFRLAVCASVSLDDHAACGYGGAVTKISNRNESIQFALTKPGFSWENTLCGARLRALLDSQMLSYVVRSASARCGCADRWLVHRNNVRSIG